MAAKKKGEDRIAEALGASRVVKLGKSRDWPLGWMGLAGIVRDRLVSRGGRPSDPNWDTKRLVPFRRATWKRLSQEAEAMSAYGRKVGPAQLAAILIEEKLATKESHQPGPEV